MCCFVNDIVVNLSINLYADSEIIMDVKIFLPSKSTCIVNHGHEQMLRRCRCVEKLQLKQTLQNLYSLFDAKQ